jgi:hypothetical protein
MAQDQRELDRAYDRLEEETPDRVTRAIRWLRDPNTRWVRLPIALLLLAAGALGPVLPLLGIELIPLGLLLLAQDIPFLKKPVGAATLWLEDRWVALRRWWKKR